MSKLVDKERLAKLAKALDDRAKAAVATEKERAMAAEQAVDAKANANTAAIAAINNETTGILAKAAADAAAKVKVEKERAEGAEAGLSGRIDTLEGKLDGAVDDFFDGAAEGTKVAQMVADIGANKAKLAGIEEGKTVKALGLKFEQVEKPETSGVTRLGGNETHWTKPAHKAAKVSYLPSKRKSLEREI